MDSIPETQHGASRITGVGVLDRCVALLDLLADGPRSLRSLADASGLPRPTAHRLLVALEAHRLVARDPAGSFRLGPRLTELAAVAGPELDLASLAGPVLDRLHQATGESVQLYVRSGEHRLCIAARDAGTGLRDSVPVGALLPLDVGSGGKVLLAWSRGRRRRRARRRAGRRAQPGLGGQRGRAGAGRGQRQRAGPARWRAAGALCVSGPGQPARPGARPQAQLAGRRRRRRAVPAALTQHAPGLTPTLG